MIINGRWMYICISSYAINIYRCGQSCKFLSKLRRGVLDTTRCDKVGRRVSPTLIYLIAMIAIIYYCYTHQKSLDEQYNGKTEKNKDKQWTTKHFTEN